MANQEDIYSLAAKPEDFFHLLDTHGISHPNYYPGIASLDSSYIYVCKRQGADGGSHVRFFEVGDTLSPDEYLQQYVPGLPASVTFVANGQSCNILGVNQLFLATVSVNQFCYAGAVQLNISDDTRKKVTGIVTKLVESTGLQGLCGLDFIITDSGEIQVLELNPRPPASMELYDSGTYSVFAENIRAYRGKSHSEFEQNQKTVKAYRVVYAGETTRIAENLIWPEWVKDRPGNSATLLKDSPICTVHVEADNRSAALRLLDERVVEMNNLISAREIVL